MVSSYPKLGRNIIYLLLSKLKYFDDTENNNKEAFTMFQKVA